VIGYCYCQCVAHGHVGICQIQATTVVPFVSDQTGPVGVPMCEACANAVLARHPLHDEEEAT
jgi:hypothetical protein